MSHASYAYGLNLASQHGESWSTPADANAIMERHWSHAKQYYGLSDEDRPEFMDGWRFSFSCDLPEDERQTLVKAWSTEPRDKSEG